MAPYPAYCSPVCYSLCKLVLEVLRRLRDTPQAVVDCQPAFIQGHLRLGMRTTASLG